MFAQTREIQVQYLIICRNISADGLENLEVFQWEEPLQDGQGREVTTEYRWWGSIYVYIYIYVFVLIALWFISNLVWCLSGMLARFHVTLYFQTLPNSHVVHNSQSIRSILCFADTLLLRQPPPQLQQQQLQYGTRNYLGQPNQEAGSVPSMLSWLMFMGRTHSKWTDFDPSTLPGCVHRHFQFKARSDMCLRQSLRGRLERQIQVCSVLSYRLFSRFAEQHLKHPEASWSTVFLLDLLNIKAFSGRTYRASQACNRKGQRPRLAKTLVRSILVCWCNGRWLEQKDSRLPKFGKKVARRPVFSVSFSAS